MSTREQFFETVGKLPIYSRLTESERGQFIKVVDEGGLDYDYETLMGYIDSRLQRGFTLSADDLFNSFFREPLFSKTLMQEMKTCREGREAIDTDYEGMYHEYDGAHYRIIKVYDIGEGVKSVSLESGNSITLCTPFDEGKIIVTGDTPRFHVGDIVVMKSSQTVGTITRIQDYTLPYLYKVGYYMEFHENNLRKLEDGESYCNRCMEVKQEDDLLDGECSTCRNRFYVTCVNCGDTIDTRDFTHVNYQGDYYCESCAEDLFTVCPHCENVFLEDDGWYHNGIMYCCEDCAIENTRSELLHSYSYKPTPVFYTMRDEKATGYYGVELEMEHGDSDVLSELATIDEIYCKEDSSLDSDGIEVVTHPCSLDYHVKTNLWNKVTELGKDYGFTSHDNGDCGLHIHASRSLFGESPMEQDYTIAKILLFIDKWWDNYIVPFSRRNLSDLSRWAKKPESDITGDDSPDTAREKTHNLYGDRYQAVNLCNANTVEFRFIRGTLKRDTIIASIQFIDLMIKYAKRLSLKRIQRMSFQDVFGKTTRKQLREYLVTKNLITVKAGK